MGLVNLGFGPWSRRLYLMSRLASCCRGMPDKPESTPPSKIMPMAGEDGQVLQVWTVSRK
jgi:hypothetical protein